MHNANHVLKDEDLDKPDFSNAKRILDNMRKKSRNYLLDALKSVG